MSLLKLDHIAFGADDLERGVAQMSELLGAEPVGGGRHDLFGTHNALWRLEGLFPTYLEVIAIDPGVSAPSRPRWFALDDKKLSKRLENGVELLAFIAGTPDMDLARQAMPVDPGTPVQVRRGALSWTFSLPADGSLPDAGALPYLITWPAGVHPVKNMPVQNIGLKGVGGRRLGELDMDWPCALEACGHTLRVDLVSASKQVRTFIRE